MTVQMFLCNLEEFKADFS